jgi:hypothetical protein
VRRVESIREYTATLLAQHLKQRFRVFEVAGIETLGEPVVDLGENI